WPPVRRRRAFSPDSYDRRVGGGSHCRDPRTLDPSYLGPSTSPLRSRRRSARRGIALAVGDRGQRGVGLGDRNSGPGRSATALWWHRALEPSPGSSALCHKEHTSELQSPCNLVCRLLL